MGGDLARPPRSELLFFDSVSILPAAPTCSSAASFTDAPWRRIAFSSLKSTLPPPSLSTSSKKAFTASFGALNPSSRIALPNSFLLTVPD